MIPVVINKMIKLILKYQIKFTKMYTKPYSWLIGYFYSKQYIHWRSTWVIEYLADC